MSKCNEVFSRAELFYFKGRLALDLAGARRLQPICARLQRDVSLPNLLMEGLQAAMDVSGADLGNVQLVDEQTGVLKIVAQRGFKGDFLEYFNAVHDGQATCGSALQRKARVIVEDVASDPIFKGSEARKVMLKAGARACQSTPLISHEGKVVGMMSTHFGAFKELPESKLRLLDLLALQTAEVIEAAQIERVLRHNERRAANAQLSGILAHELNNPLQALTNIVALLSQQPASEEARAWLKMARREVERLTETTQRLLVGDRYEHPGDNSPSK